MKYALKNTHTMKLECDNFAQQVTPSIHIDRIRIAKTKDIHHIIHCLRLNFIWVHIKVSSLSSIVYNKLKTRKSYCKWQHDYIPTLIRVSFPGLDTN